MRVAELGSFSKAALVLKTAQPALSRQVRALETELRANLLHRTGRGVVLTEAGQRLMEHGLGILELVARAREAVRASHDEPSGRLVVGIPPSLGQQLAVPLVEMLIELVEVPDEEFYSMGANVLAIAPRSCVMVEGNPITRDRLEAVGARVAEYRGREISLKGGGGPTCLTRPIERA